MHYNMLFVYLELSVTSLSPYSNTDHMFIAPHSLISTLHYALNNNSYFFSPGILYFIYALCTF